MKSPLWIICVVIVAFASSLGAAAVRRSYEHRRANGLVIIAVAHEWWWDFQYPGLGIAHDSEPHLPVGIPVHLTLTSADVLHAFGCRA
jgi:cytochrome c oxidase subunit 2